MSIDGALNKLEREEFRTKKTSYIPHKFSLCITSKCNLRCPTCLYLLQDPTYFDNKKFMSFDDYKSLLLKYQNDLKVLTLTGGEPLLHPQFEEFVDFANSLNISVGFATNGTLIAENIEACKKVNGFRISLDAHNYETYKTSRAGTERQWNKILSDIQLARENDIDFEIAFLVSRDNIGDIFDMLKFADEIKPTWVHFNSLNPYKENDPATLRSDDIQVMNIISKIMDKKDYSYNIAMPHVFNNDEASSKKVCDYPWIQLSADEYGNVAYCCHTKHDARIGNVKKGYDFNSERMQKWRQTLLDNKLPIDCKYCHKRFYDESVQFSAKDKVWHKSYSVSEKKLSFKTENLQSETLL